MVLTSNLFKDFDSYRSSIGVPSRHRYRDVAFLLKLVFYVSSVCVLCLSISGFPKATPLKAGKQKAAPKKLERGPCDTGRLVDISDERWNDKIRNETHRDATFFQARVDEIDQNLDDTYTQLKATADSYGQRASQSEADANDASSLWERLQVSVYDATQTVVNLDNKLELLQANATTEGSDAEQVLEDFFSNHWWFRKPFGSRRAVNQSEMLLLKQADDMHQVDNVLHQSIAARNNAEMFSKEANAANMTYNFCTLRAKELQETATEFRKIARSIQKMSHAWNKTKTDLLQEKERKKRNPACECEELADTKKPSSNDDSFSIQQLLAIVALASLGLSWMVAHFFGVITLPEVDTASSTGTDDSTIGSTIAIIPVIAQGFLGPHSDYGATQAGCCDRKRFAEDEGF